MTEEEKKFLTNSEISTLLDGLDELRKTDRIAIGDLMGISELSDKLIKWLSSMKTEVDIIEKINSGFYSIPENRYTDIKDDTGTTPLGK